MMNLIVEQDVVQVRRFVLQHCVQLLVYFMEPELLLVLQVRWVRFLYGKSVRSLLMLRRKMVGETESLLCSLPMEFLGAHRSLFSDTLTFFRRDDQFISSSTLSTIVKFSPFHCVYKYSRLTYCLLFWRYSDVLPILSWAWKLPEHPRMNTSLTAHNISLKLQRQQFTKGKYMAVKQWSEGNSIKLK